MSYLSSHTGQQIDDAVDAVSDLQDFMKEPWLHMPGAAMPLTSLMADHLLDTNGDAVTVDAVSFLQQMNAGVFKSDLPDTVMRNIPMLWFMYSGPEGAERSMQMHYVGTSHTPGTIYVETHYYATRTQVDFDGKEVVLCFGIRYSSTNPGKYLLSAGYVADVPDYAETLRADLVAGATEGYTPEWFFAKQEA